MKIRHEVIFPNELFSGRGSGRSQSLKINHYLLFSWVFVGVLQSMLQYIAVNWVFVGNLGLFGGMWQMWDR